MAQNCDIICYHLVFLILRRPKITYDHSTQINCSFFAKVGRKVHPAKKIPACLSEKFEDQQIKRWTTFGFTVMFGNVVFAIASKFLSMSMVNSIPRHWIIPMLLIYFVALSVGSFFLTSLFYRQPLRKITQETVMTQEQQKAIQESLYEPHKFKRVFDFLTSPEAQPYRSVISPTQYKDLLAALVKASEGGSEPERQHVFENLLYVMKRVQHMNPVQRQSELSVFEEFLKNGSMEDTLKPRKTSVGQSGNVAVRLEDSTKKIKPQYLYHN